MEVGSTACSGHKEGLLAPRGFFVKSVPKKSEENMRLSEEGWGEVGGGWCNKQSEAKIPSMFLLYMLL
jgi:hypothetical protein